MLKKARLYLLSLLLFTAVGLAVLTITEFTVRYINTKDVTETRDHLVNPGYMPAKMKPNYSGRIWDIPFKTNEFGLRDEESFSARKPAGEYRIMSLGDSIAFGLGLDAEDHYTKILQRNLNASGDSRHFRVVNASGPGFSPTCYYLYLQNEGLLLEPDMLIVEIELCNDVTDEALIKWETSPENGSVPVAAYGGRYIVGWDGNLLATYSSGSFFYEETYTYTVLARRFLNLMKRIRPRGIFEEQKGVTYYSLGFDRYLLTDEVIESGWAKLFGALRATRDMAESRGIEFRLLIMPTRFMYDDKAKPYRDFAQGLVERAVEMAQAEGFKFLDFTDAMAEGGTSLYFDFAHPNEAGNQIIGERLTDFIGSDPAVGLQPAGQP